MKTKGPDMRISGSVNGAGKACVIVPTAETDGTKDQEYELALIGDLREVWATSKSARLLAQFAFDCGAISVRHDYDMVAEHARFHG